MIFTIKGACLCNTGKVRRKNEDNFYFDGQCMNSENNGLSEPVVFEKPLRKDCFAAVFDGMGGENFGEFASYAAARKTMQIKRKIADRFKPVEAYLESLSMQLNDAVVEEKNNMYTDRMGTTMVGLYFTMRRVYVCNIGDSRAYRLRGTLLTQLSVDHVEKRVMKPGRKAPLTQHLGIDPEEMLIEPHIAMRKLRKGDRYLVCSDGITDMLTDTEIKTIIRRSKDPKHCVQSLVDAAMNNGGRDNITAVLLKIE